MTRRSAESPISNGSYWPELPPDALCDAVIAHTYRRPRERSGRAIYCREFRRTRPDLLAHLRRVGR